VADIASVRESSISFVYHNRTFARIRAEMSPPPTGLGYRIVKASSLSSSGEADGLSYERTSAPLLFVFSFLYCWISIYPFESLATLTVGSAALNQLVGFGAAVAVVVFAFRNHTRSLMLQPKLLVGTVFGWLAIASLVAPDIVTALHRLVFTGVLCVLASGLVLMPSDQPQFSRFLAIFSIAVLLLCYFGVLVVPARSVHQAYDLGEPALAGDWRGVFAHKNITAPAMVMLIFFGLYLAGAWSKTWGAVIAVLALLFLIKTHGKTANMMLPLTLLLVWWMTRYPRLASFALISVIAAFNFVALGSALSSSIYKFVASIGIDPTFTGRTDVWQLALNSVAKSPFIGYGFQSFWQKDELLKSADVASTWAVAAAHSHNSYIETLLNGGLPALVLTLVWFLFLPLRDFRAAVDRNIAPDLTRLFARMWVFSILSASLESNFFLGTIPIWTSLLMAMFGLRLQARASLVAGAPVEKAVIQGITSRSRVP
jgi:O-antigen ligase